LGISGQRQELGKGDEVEGGRDEREGRRKVDKDKIREILSVLHGNNSRLG
jgi:hypothetical protein